MIDLTHAHISYLKQLREQVMNFKLVSATKKKLAMDMIEHGLIRVEEDLIYVEDKARELVKHVESETKQWLSSHL